jgi:hypothetical protein
VNNIQTEIARAYRQHHKLGEYKPLCSNKDVLEQFYLSKLITEDQWCEWEGLDDDSIGEIIGGLMR